MADTTTLNYVVDGYDKQYMVIHVSFPDDGTKVNIGVVTFPTTQAELDALVAPYAKHQETVAAQTAAGTANTTFISSVVGKTSTTTRYSMTAQSAAVQASINATNGTTSNANDFVVANTTKTQAQSNMQQADLEYIKSLIAEALAAQSTTTTPAITITGDVSVTATSSTTTAAASSTASTTTETASSTAS